MLGRVMIPKVTETVLDLTLFLPLLFFQYHSAFAQNVAGAERKDWYSDKGRISCLRTPLPAGSYGTGYKVPGGFKKWTSEDFDNNALDLCSAHSKRQAHYQGWVRSIFSFFFCHIFFGSSYIDSFDMSNMLTSSSASRYLASFPRFKSSGIPLSQTHMVLWTNES